MASAVMMKLEGDVLGFEDEMEAHDYELEELSSSGRLENQRQHLLKAIKSAYVKGGAPSDELIKKLNDVNQALSEARSFEPKNYFDE